jgi:DNA-binding helix-hairpin-helix protein with protein kinase domain
VNKYLTGNGNTIRLGTVLGRGGEGTVFSLQTDNNLAAKLYLPQLAAERRIKITQMVSAKLHASASFVAYPIDTIFDGRGAFCGFTMRIVSGRKPAHQFYSPAGRKTAFPKATFPMLVRTTTNIARAVHNVHTSGCVIGDLNHSGVLVSSDATVVLIDSDSFQFSYNGTVYPCRVGVQEFTPPELQGKDLSKIFRTANHDNFGLAVLIFYTLMMGRHPFAGRYLAQGDMPMDRAIAQFRFAYSARRSSTLMEPPPNVPTLSDLPISLGDAFERSFGPSGATGARPSASEWISIIEKAEGELVRCSVSSAHHYFRAAKNCPWCRMERAYPGFLAFVPVFPVQTGDRPLDLGQLISAVHAVKDPGPAPDLGQIMPAVVRPTPNGNRAKWDKARKNRFRRRIGAIIGFAFGLFLLTTEPPGPLFAVLAIVASAIAVFLPLAGVSADESKRARLARTTWEEEKRDFERNAGSSSFNHARREAEDLIGRLQENLSEEARRLTDLTKRKRDLQLRDFLEQHDISLVKIKGIGDSRKLTLKSYGIETAADVEYTRIVAISGFGPAVANSLLAWRQKLERNFQFNPAKAIDPADINLIKLDYANMRANIEVRAQQAISKLQKAAADALAVRVNPGTRALDAWIAFKNAEEFEQALQPSTRETAQLLCLGIVCIVSLLVYSSQRFSRPVHPEYFNQQTVPTQAPSPEPQASNGDTTPPPPKEEKSAPRPTPGPFPSRPSATVAEPSADTKTVVAPTLPASQPEANKNPANLGSNSPSADNDPKQNLDGEKHVPRTPSVPFPSQPSPTVGGPANGTPVIVTPPLPPSQLEASKNPDNFQTCISGNYPLMCKHDLLTNEEAAQVAAAEKRENFRTCISGNYPLLCKHDLLTREEVARVAAAEVSENFRTCISGNYPLLCKHNVLTREEQIKVRDAERRANYHTCIDGNYPLLCKHSLLTPDEAAKVAEAERRANRR